MQIPNLITRILTGIVFVVILLGGIVLNEYIYLGVFSLILILALKEFYELINEKQETHINIPLNVVGGLFLFLGSYCIFSSLHSSAILLAPFILYILALFISTLFSYKPNILKTLSFSLFGQLYIALSFALLNGISFDKTDSYYNYIFILAMFIFVWVNDSFAYLTGSFLGKNKLFERISPKKTWEGAAGGALFTLVAAVIVSFFYKELSLTGWIGFALVVVVFGTLGDLFESLLKRKLEVKDSGNVLPGHGGILDRFDSAIFAIPALFVYMEVYALLV